MNNSGPSLEVLLDHLAACPGEFLMEPRMVTGGIIYVDAVVSDLFRSLDCPPLSGNQRATFRNLGDSIKKRNYLSTVLIGCRFFHYGWFRGKKEIGDRVFSFFSIGLSRISQSNVFTEWIEDVCRREEFVRLALAAVDMRPDGESRAIAEDRLASIDTLGRLEVIKASLAAVDRQNEIRKKMAEKAAQEAATRYGRE